MGNALLLELNWPALNVECCVMSTPPLAPKLTDDVSVYLVLNDLAHLVAPMSKPTKPTPPRGMSLAISAAATTHSQYKWWLSALPRDGPAMPQRTLHNNC